MTQYLLVGDCHGDVSFVSKITKAAKALGIHTVLQLGDFGIWDHREDGQYFLDTLNQNAVKANVRWVFVPGNHENYDRLENYEATGLRTDEGFVPIRENIHYTGKTNVWTWEDKTFAAAGGAVSIDRASRKPGSSWWPQEQLSLKELSELEAKVDSHKKLGSTAMIDVLLTHDSPTTLPTWPGFLKDDPVSQEHRERMDKVGLMVHPTWWFHGHYHVYISYKYNNTTVVGLACNDDAMPWTSDGFSYKNWAVWDTADDSLAIAPWHEVTKAYDEANKRKQLNE